MVRWIVHPPGGAPRTVSGKPAWERNWLTENKEDRLGRETSSHHGLPCKLAMGNRLATNGSTPDRGNNHLTGTKNAEYIANGAGTHDTTADFPPDILVSAFFARCIRLAEN